jgi:hypothetical protein
MRLTVIDIAQRVTGKGAQRFTIKNVGDVPVYFGRTAAEATVELGLPVEPSEGLFIDGPLFVSAAIGQTGLLAVLPPA